MLYILLSCVLLLCIFSLTYSCTHSPDFMFYDCALTCYPTTMMTMMYSHCIHIEAHSIYTIYFLGRVKGFFFWFQQNSFTLKLYRLESSSSSLRTPRALWYSFLVGILACLHFIPPHSDRSSQCWNITCTRIRMGKLSSESALIRKLMWKNKKNKNYY
jgi:hypothetical protein